MQVTFLGPHSPGTGWFYWQHRPFDQPGQRQIVPGARPPREGQVVALPRRPRPA